MNVLRNQLRTLISLVVLIAVCVIVITGIISQKDGTVAIDSYDRERTRIIENVKITGVVSDTKVNYTIETERLSQFPERGISILHEPRISQTDADGFKRILKANSGKYYEDSHTVSLKGDVEISLIDPDDTVTVASTIDDLTFNLDSLQN